MNLISGKVKPAAGHRPLAYSSPEAVQTTGTVAFSLRYTGNGQTFLAFTLDGSGDE
jgi:hypothetical protein